MRCISFEPLYLPYVLLIWFEEKNFEEKLMTTTFIKANKGRSNTKWSPLADYSLSKYFL